MGNRVIYRPAYDAEVEYLESTGTQWIDTNFHPDSATTSFELDISFEGTFRYDGTTKRIISTSTIENDTMFLINFGGYSHEGKKFYCWFGRKYDSELIGFPTHINVPSLTRGILRYAQGVVSYQGQSVDYYNTVYPPIAGTRQGTMCILKDLECYDARLYGAKIWNQDTLVRDFIPVRIGSVGYMYDKVTKQLFANKGTGQFILGNDVSNAVIPQQRCVLYFGNQRSVIYERIYEEYEWLRVTLPYGNNYYTYVPINSDNFKFTTIIESGYNLGHFTTNHYWYYTSLDTNKDISIWNTLDKVTENRIDVGSSTLVFESSSNDFKVNGVSITKYGFPVKNLILYSKGADLSKLISSVSVDGVVRYVPCKLLVSIPAILDGNGIARQAGECGMWDKVNDVFYGNVASSGSFTVSND